MFDFPDPFGPTTTHTPGSNSSVVLSAKDLKPFSVNDLRNKQAPSPAADGRGRAPTPADRPTVVRTSRALMRLTDAKPLIADRWGPSSTSTAVDPRPRRAGPAPRDEPVDGRGRTLELGLDRAVAAVAHPAADAPRRGPVRGTSRGTTRPARGRSPRPAPGRVAARLGHT